MNNLQQPAFQTTGWEESGKGPAMYSNHEGFTKLEYAAILITNGLLSNSSWNASLPTDNEKIAAISVSLAKALIEKCNK